MIKRNSLLLGMGFSMLMAAPINAVFAAEGDISAEQKAKIEKIVHEYVVSHPEVLVEAARSLEKKQKEQIAEQAKSTISQSKASLFDGPSPVTGNEKGNVTLVEFFDYQCIHCKKMSVVIDQLLKKDKNLRVVFKELPIFGPSSELTAKAALASQKQGKYVAFHNALMAEKQSMNKARMLKVAASVGLDTKKLEEDMKSADVQKELDANVKLAQELRLGGTPAFVIAGYPFKENTKSFFVPGSTTSEAFVDLIAQARGTQAKNTAAAKTTATE